MENEWKYSVYHKDLEKFKLKFSIQVMWSIMCTLNTNNL